MTRTIGLTAHAIGVLRIMVTAAPAVDADTAERVARELKKYGVSVVRQLLPAAAIQRARTHLEQCVERHLSTEVAAGRLADACAGLPLEERMARAYAADPSAAPCSWVPQTRTAFAFQQLLFRDAGLCSLVSALTEERADDDQPGHRDHR